MSVGALEFELIKWWSSKRHEKKMQVDELVT
uniref:Uncharacterized protein n=1 Tax=Anguilla anguilla TaxID=7936 RepID=A0A0E9XY97_ANGAN